MIERYADQRCSTPLGRGGVRSDGIGRVARHLALAGIIGTLATVALWLAPAAGSAAGLVPTKTNLVAMPSIVGPTDTATLTATVKYGLVVTPTGSVTFTDSTTHTTLGSAPLTPLCLLALRQCTATLHVSGSALGSGDNVILAGYPGDLISGPSSGSTHLYTPPPGDEVTCAANQPCEASGTSADGTASLDVQADAAPGPDTVEVAFGTEPLSCTTPGTGDTGVYNVSNPTVNKVVNYFSFGPAADAAEAAHPIGGGGTGGYVCFESSIPFTTAGGGTSGLQIDGYYQGVLPACVPIETYPATNEPCVEGSSFITSPPLPADQYYTQVFAGPGEPKLSQ